MIKIYTKAFPLKYRKEVEKEIQYYIDSKWEILSVTSELHGEFGHVMVIMEWDEANSGIFDPWTGHTVRYKGKLHKVVACSPNPDIVFNDGSKHYAMWIESIYGDSDDLMMVNDAQVELVEDRK